MRRWRLIEQVSPRRIGLYRKRMELEVLEKLAKSRQAKASADAEAVAILAKAKLVNEAESFAKLRMEAIELEAEERLLACLEQG